jgi:hypothetical protein
MRTRGVIVSWEWAGLSGGAIGVFPQLGVSAIGSRDRSLL